MNRNIVARHNNDGTVTINGINYSILYKDERA